MAGIHQGKGAQSGIPGRAKTHAKDSLGNSPVCVCVGERSVEWKETRLQSGQAEERG